MLKQDLNYIVSLKTQQILEVTKDASISMHEDDNIKVLLNDLETEYYDKNGAGGYGYC